MSRKSLRWLILAVLVLQGYSRVYLYYVYRLEDNRWVIAKRDIFETVQRTVWPAYRPEEQVFAFLIVGSNDISAMEIERFQAEMHERFQQPITCETAEWLWKRGGSLSARSAQYTFQYREMWERNVLNRMDCPISPGLKRYLDWGRKKSLEASSKKSQEQSPAP